MCLFFQSLLVLIKKLLSHAHQWRVTCNFFHAFALSWLATSFSVTMGSFRTSNVSTQRQFAFFPWHHLDACHQTRKCQRAPNRTAHKQMTDPYCVVKRSTTAPQWWHRCDLQRKQPSQRPTAVLPSIWRPSEEMGRIFNQAPDSLDEEASKRARELASETFSSKSSATADIRTIS